MSNEDDKTIIRFIIILVIVLLCCVGFYFATKYLVNKNETTEENETTKEVEIDDSVAIIGTMLNKNPKEYYVILFDNSSNNKELYTYQTLISQYKSKDRSLNLYTVDLSNGMNKPYYDKDSTNPKASELKDLRFGDITLLKIENKKITNAYESVDEIKSVWKLS